MADGIKIAIIGGVFGLIGSIIGQLDRVHDILVSIGIKQATHVYQVSESIPLSESCDDESDLGRIILHSSSNGKAGIFFCPQGKSPNYNKPEWYVIKADDVGNY